MVDTSPEALGNLFSGFMTGNIGELLVKTMIWMIIIFAIGVVFFIIYMFITYKYKLIIFRTQGDGKGGITLSKFFIDFARDCKDKSWKLLRKRKNIEPFPDSLRYGKWCFAYQVDNEIEPGTVKLSKEGMSIEAIPYSVRKKTELELQQLEQDFAKMDAWTTNKIFIGYVVAVVAVVVLAGFVLWLSFKKTDQLIPAMDSFGNAIKSINTISGKG